MPIPTGALDRFDAAISTAKDWIGQPVPDLAVTRDQVAGIEQRTVAIQDGLTSELDYAAQLASLRNSSARIAQRVGAIAQRENRLEARLKQRVFARQLIAALILLFKIAVPLAALGAIYLFRAEIIGGLLSLFPTQPSVGP
jgi:hypothetical protein